MCERGFVSLTVPQTSAGKISAVGRVNHRRTFPVAECSPSQIRDIGHQLIESRVNKIDELQFEDRPATISGETASHPEDGRFSQGRIENLLRKFGRKLLSQPE